MNPGRPNKSAFTLMELLVAVAITVVLAGLMLMVVTNTLDLWRKTQDAFTTSAQATLALDLIERDLQAAVFRADDENWLAAEVINTPASLAFHGWTTRVSMKPAGAESQRLVPESGHGSAPLIAEARFGLSGVWLRFVTTNLESSGALPVAVSYQLARRPVSGAIAATNPADVRYTLFRSAISPGGTLAVGNDVTAAGYASASATPAGTRNPRTLTNPNTADALASNVVDFGVWLQVREPATGALRRIYPADNLDLLHVAHDLGAAPDDRRFPEVADVMIRVLSEQGAALLAEMEQGGGHLIRPRHHATDAEWWWGIVETHSRVYFRRVILRGASR